MMTHCLGLEHQFTKLMYTWVELPKACQFNFPSKHLWAEFPFIEISVYA